MSVTSNAEFLPSLPGFKPREIPTGQKAHYFSKKGDVTFVKEEGNMPGEGLDEGSMASFSSGTLARTGRKINAENINVTLTFHAYFEEAANAPGNNTDKSRIRKCNIYYFLEDDTISIVEKPQMNSGIPQGKLVKRSVILRPDGFTYNLDDLRVGESVTIFCREYKIISCDESTRRYLLSIGREETEGADYPTDPYEATRRRQMHPGMTATNWDRFHSKKNPNKLFMEAQLGNTVNNSGRQGFITYGSQTLRFHCVWDNTGNLYGDRMDYSLVYHLSDDSIEINSVGGAAKSEQFSRLLKRSRLPKGPHILNLGVSDHKNADSSSGRTQSEFYHFSDFYIGQELQVYARTLRVVDADNFTREFYAKNVGELGTVEVKEQAEVIVNQREIPAYTGFGSEEDSLRSCTGSLLPGPVPAKKLGENKVCSFFASLLSGGPDDVDRKFVVQLFIIDHTMKVQEPPLRNSGFVGGVFLSRRQVKGADGNYLTEKDLYVGCQLKILNHVFLLHSANPSTLHWMESKKLPKASYYAVLDKIRPYLIREAESGQLAEDFKTIEEGSNPGAEPGQASKDTLKKILATINLIGDEPDQVCEHEMLTILRANGNTKPTFNYEKWIEQMLAPTDEFA